MKFAEYESPCGHLLIGVLGARIFLCDWILGDRIERTLRRINRFLSCADIQDKESLLEDTARELDAYFSGIIRSFEIPILPLGTDFQRHVWDTLSHIPYGQTVSYRGIAESVGLSGGVRAVASAIGANPLSVIVPCHRVVGSDGSLTGYAGGLEAKRHLLQLESDSLYSTI